MKPTTKAETKVPTESIALNPVRYWPPRTEATDAKTSGAPLPKAKRVTAPIVGERFSWLVSLVVTMEKWS